MKKILNLLLMAVTVTIAAMSCDTEKTMFTVTFDSQGGSEVPAASVEEGSKVAKPTNPTNDPLFFAGWYKEANCLTAWSFENDVVTADLTLYAKWSEEQVEEPEPESMLYAFEGDVCVIYNENGDMEMRLTYTPNGAFPLGTYTTTDMVLFEIDCDINGECDTTYVYQKIELLSGSICTLSVKMAGDTDWSKVAEGTFVMTGTQATGGTISLMFEYPNEGDEPERPSETYNYSFNEDIVTISDNAGYLLTTLTCTPTGEFPLGTYVSEWTEGGTPSATIYMREKYEVLPNGAFAAYQQEARDIADNNSYTQSEQRGTYEITGNKANGGTITITLEEGNDVPKKISRPFGKGRFQ
ncbi:MAG: InlB B-repeat-containing protein, partial [Bacteroidales bacterium]|jgi:uncharacterized repeat protein (TIGR02543 family)|nr:InlB B-repeat-containing protein [Bacteroidales bacterium]